MRRTFVLAGLIGVLSAAPAMPSWASPHHLKTIERACGTQLRLSPDACACIAAHAARLKEPQQAFIAALVTRNKQSMSQLRGMLSPKDLTQAGMFMTTVSGRCSR